MAECKLSKNFEISECSKLPAGGLTGAVYFIDFEEWLSSDNTLDNTGALTDIELAEGAKFIKYDLPITSPMPATEVVRNAGGLSGYKHTVELYLPKINQEIRGEFTKLLNFGRVAVIVVRDSDEVSTMYGGDSGLVLTGFTETPADAAVGGGAKITLATPEAGMESVPTRAFKMLPTAADGDEPARNPREHTIYYLDSNTVEITIG